MFTDIMYEASDISLNSNEYYMSYQQCLVDIGEGE